MKIWSIVYYGAAYEIPHFAVWQDGQCPNIGIIGKNAKRGWRNLKENLSQYMAEYDWMSDIDINEVVSAIKMELSEGNVIHLADSAILRLQLDWLHMVSMAFECLVGLAAAAYNLYCGCKIIVQAQLE